MASQTGGALLWGLIADQVGLRPAVLGAAAAVALGVVAALFLRVPETGHLDPQLAVPTGPTRSWPSIPNSTRGRCWSPCVSPSGRAAGGLSGGDDRAPPVPAPDRGDQLGALPDGERPDRFVEIFRIASWEEHLRQHDGG